MKNEVIVANLTSAGAVGACIAQIEPILTLLVILTALAVNIKTLFKRKEK